VEFGSNEFQAAGTDTEKARPTTEAVITWRVKRCIVITRNAGVAVRTADGSRRTADAGDEVWLQQSVVYRTVVLCAAWTVADDVSRSCTESVQFITRVLLITVLRGVSCCCC